MTEVPPPPPPGAYPPPGGYPPPPPPGIGQLPGGNFETWIKRVGAFLIDDILAGIIYGIGYGIAMATATSSGCEGVSYSDSYGGSASYTCSAQPSGLGLTALFLFGLASFAFGLWNWGYKQGTTGSTIGKNLLGIKVVGELTGQPIGFGMSVVRQIAHVIDAIICYIGFLLPLFTAKRQTIADMLVKTVVIPK